MVDRSWIPALAIGLGALAAAGTVALATRAPATAPGVPHPATNLPTPVTPPATRTGPPGHSAPGPPPCIAVEAPEFDFGRLRQGEDPQHVFRFRNTGQGPLHIERIHPNCGCLPVLRSPRDVPPGGTGEIAVTLQTAALLGRVGKTVDVYTDDPAHPVVTLTLLADVHRPFVLEPATFDFGEVARGARVTRVVTLRHVDDIAFEIVECSTPPEGFELRALPADPATPGVRRLELTVTPAWTLESSTGRVFIRTDPATPAPLWIPYSARAAQPLTLDPWQVHFGRVAQGTRPTPQVRLAAADGRPFAVTGVRVTPPDEVRVTTARDGDAWVLTLRPGPAWPSTGRVSGVVRVATDRFPVEVVVPYDGTQLGGD